MAPEREDEVVILLKECMQVVKDELEGRTDAQAALTMLTSKICLIKTIVQYS